MDRISFDIYKPDGKYFHLTPDWIVYGSWFLAIGFCWLYNKIYPDDTSARTIIAIVVFLLSMCYLVASFFTYRSLNGIIEGKIIFEDSKIIIDKAEFTLNDISGIDFSFSDYYGRRISAGRSFNQQLSQGVGNSFSFADSQGNQRTFYMKFMGEHSYLALSDFINEAVRKKKMSFNRAADLIGIENVSISA